MISFSLLIDFVKTEEKSLVLNFNKNMREPEATKEHIEALRNITVRKSNFFPATRRVVSKMTDEELVAKIRETSFFPAEGASKVRVDSWAAGMIQKMVNEVVSRETKKD